MPTAETHLAGHDFRGHASGALTKRRRGLAALDLVVVAGALTLSELVRGRIVWLPAVICLCAWFLATSMAGTLSSGAVRMRRQGVATLIAACGLCGVIAAIALALPGEELFAVTFTVLVFVVSLFGRLLLFARMDRSPIGLALIADRRTVIDLWPTLVSLLGPGYRVSAVLDIEEPQLLDHLVSVLSVRPVDLVVTTSPSGSSVALDAVMHVCAVRGSAVMSFDNLYEDLTGRCLNPETVPSAPARGGLWRRLGSRTLDYVAFVVALPIWFTAMALAKLSGGARPVSRTFVGKGGQPVNLRVFESDSSSRHAGPLLGKTPLQWLPSSSALLLGRLSLVGPRPLTPDQVKSGTAWTLRNAVTPGVTGWAQINGFVDGDEGLAYDLYYVLRRSFSFDLGILMRTLAGPLLSWRAMRVAFDMPRRETEVISRQAVTVSSSDDLVSVIVPAFREGSRIAASLEMLIEEMAALGSPFEVIVVSDGNTDGTEIEATRVRGPLTVIHYPSNRGKGYAIRRGVADSHGGRVVFIDADMELHPRGVGILLSLVDAGADVAIGSKRHVDSRVNYPLVRRVQSRAYQWLVSQLFGLNVTDTQTGIKAFRGDLLRSVTPNLTNEGFAFDLELLVELTSRGAVIAEGPVTLNYSFASTTSVGSAYGVLRETLRLWHRRRKLGGSAELRLPGDLNP